MDVALHCFHKKMISFLVCRRMYSSIAKQPYLHRGFLTAGICGTEVQQVVIQVNLAWFDIVRKKVKHEVHDSITTMILCVCLWYNMQKLGQQQSYVIIYACAHFSPSPSQYRLCIPQLWLHQYTGKYGKYSVVWNHIDNRWEMLIYKRHQLIRTDEWTRDTCHMGLGSTSHYKQWGKRNMFPVKHLLIQQHN